VKPKGLKTGVEESLVSMPLGDKASSLNEFAEAVS